MSLAVDGTGEQDWKRRPVGRGGLVAWEGVTCRVVRRRRVSPLAVPRVSEFELYLEAVGGGFSPGWVPEPEVENLSDSNHVDE